MSLPDCVQKWKCKDLNQVQAEKLWAVAAEWELPE